MDGIGLGKGFKMSIRVRCALGSGKRNFLKVRRKYVSSGWYCPQFDSMNLTFDYLNLKLAWGITVGSLPVICLAAAARTSRRSLGLSHNVSCSPGASGGAGGLAPAE